MRLFTYAALLSLTTLTACSDDPTGPSSNPGVPPARANLLPGQTLAEQPGVGDTGSNGDQADAQTGQLETPDSTNNPNSGQSPAAGTPEIEPDLQGTEGANQQEETGSGDGSSDQASTAEDPDLSQENADEQPAVDPQETEQPPAEVSVATEGCGNGNRQVGGFNVSLGGVNTAYTVTLPMGYNPDEPTPLVFGFHGRGQTHIQFQSQDASGIETELGSRAIMVYVKSHQIGNGWNAAAEVEPNVEVFEELFPQILDNYCVDSSRVFAVGHSSGGFFSNILACRFPERFLGIGSVAGATQECSGKVAAFIVHGIRDAVVDYPRGQASRDGYIAGNGCSDANTPTNVSPCIAYQGCDEGFPVQWCQHNEPTYQDTNHGWPSFASQALGQFLFNL